MFFIVQDNKEERGRIWNSLPREKKLKLINFVRAHERSVRQVNPREGFVVQTSDSLWRRYKLSLEEVIVMTARRLAVFDNKMRSKRLRVVKLKLAKRAVKGWAKTALKKFKRK